MTILGEIDQVIESFLCIEMRIHIVSSEGEALPEPSHDQFRGCFEVSFS